MTALEPEVPPERRKRTVLLLAGGAVSLMLPLLGVVYLRWNATRAAPGPSGRSDVFERRDGSDKRITPSQTAVPPAAMAPPPPAATSMTIGGKAETPAGSSLDFIKPNAEISAKMAEAPKPATATAPAPVAAPVAAAPAAPTAPAAKTPAKKGKKEFAMPKLNVSRGFTTMGGKGGSSAKGSQTAAPAGNDTQDLLKNLPPGAENNPQLQQYLKSQGK